MNKVLLIYTDFFHYHIKHWMRYTEIYLLNKKQSVHFEIEQKYKTKLWQILDVYQRIILNISALWQKENFGTPII